MSAATQNGGGAAVVDQEEMLQIMKLTSEEEQAMFHKLLAWWKGRSIRLSLPIDDSVGAALITRVLLANTQARLKFQRKHASTSGVSNRPSIVTPEETSPGDDKEENVVIRSMRRRRAKKLKDSVEKESDAKKANTDNGMRNQYLVNLASDLGAVLATLSASDKTSIPTVAYITSAYYFMFKGGTDKKPSDVATEMIKEVLDENALEEDICKYSTLIQKMLLATSRSGKVSVEAYADFEYIWNTCVANPSFREAIGNVTNEYADAFITSDTNENGKRSLDARSTPEVRLQSAKELCWKLACYAEQDHKELKSAYVTARRRRILGAAACLALVTSLPDLDATSPKDDGDKGSSDAEDKEDDSSHASRASKKSRTTEDAVEALVGMVKGRAPPAQPSSAGHVSTPMEIIMISTNHLIASLQPFFLPKQDITLPELQHSVMHYVKFFTSSGSSDDGSEITDESTTEDLSKLKSFLPTKAKRALLVNADAISKALANGVKQAVRDFDSKLMEEASFTGFPFVDEEMLVSEDANVIRCLCMASYKASSDGVALISQYDTSDIFPTWENSAATPLNLLFPGNQPTTAMRDAMDLNEWIASILSISDVRPRTKLMLYLEASDDESVKKKRKRADGVTEEITTGGGWRTVMVPLLNRAIERLIDDVPQPNDENPRPRRVSISDKDGALIVHGDQEDLEVKLCKALIALYYQSLEALLYHETARLMSASHPSLIMNELFHRAALTCCCVCLMKGLCSSSALAISDKFLDLDLPCIQQIMESCPYTYLKVSESFARALKLYKLSGQGQQSQHVLGLPRILQKQLSQCEVLVIDSLMWSTVPNYSLDLTVMDIINDIKSMPDKGVGSSWPPQVLEPSLPEEMADAMDNEERKAMVRGCQRPPDHLYLSYIIRKLLKIAFFRISALCSKLSIPPEYPIASQVWIAFRYLLRHRIELLYDRHVDQLILCTMYGVCKMMKFEPELTFSKIIEVYSTLRGPELGERACHRLVRHIKLASKADMEATSAKKQEGNIIQFYNTLFVPALKQHLLKSKSLKQAVAKVQKYRANPNLAAEDSSNYVREDVAARIDKLTNDSGNWANEQNSVAVTEGNVKMNVILPNASNTFDPAHPRKKPNKRKTQGLSGENRSFFSFGGASTQVCNPS